MNRIVRVAAFCLTLLFAQHTFALPSRTPRHANKSLALALKQEQGHWFLVANKARLALTALDALPSKSDALPNQNADLLTRNNTEFHLPNGDIVTLPAGKAGLSVRAQTGQTQEIDIADVLKQWLLDDSKWNGHTFGNYIRYTNSHDGLTVGLDDATLFNGALLAILTTHSAGGSGQALKSQQLVRVETTPVLRGRLKRFVKACRITIWNANLTQPT